jgi:hypothetical protein
MPTAAEFPRGLAVTRTSPSLWRVTFNNPPINLIHPPMIRYKHVAVVLFDSADADFCPQPLGSHC